MRAHLVRPVRQPFLQQERGPVGKEPLPLHLPEAQPSAPLSPLDGLLRHLVAHHVAQPLVVDDPDEDVGLN